MPRIQDLPTVEERRSATEDARRKARFKFAEQRIRKIVDAAPPLTEEQRRQLAALLALPAGGAR
ncbi:hypothetical protein HDA40_006101 [Hamadaea flava]|uniref:hypothetical protein n=1 Tax=Hamadaea flava TaxID=1742688 RepID=UPI0036D2609F|nr:hypothetical protein [Hamadaea flava]